MRENATSGIPVGVLLVGLALAGPCLGAEEGMQLRPRALRPGDTLSVTPGVRLDASKNDLPVHFERYVTDRARRAAAADCQGQPIAG